MIQKTKAKKNGAIGIHVSSMEDNREKKQKKMATTNNVGKRRRKRIIFDDKKPPLSDLLQELLEMIKKRLLFMELKNHGPIFRAVCKSWSCIERLPPLQQMPWLLVFDNDVSFYKLVDSKYKKTYKIYVKSIKEKFNFSTMKVDESKYGWVLFSIKSNYQNHTRLLLYSLFFSEGYNLIELPVLNCLISWATFTSNPLDKNCKILTLNTPDNTIRINTYRCSQNSWSSQNFECKFKPWYAPHSIYSEGNFYYETCNDTMVKFDLALEEWTVFPRLPPSMSHLEYYRVKSSDGELFIILECNLNERYTNWRYESRIYRLNLSSMIWEDLDSIGDRVLFFGDGYNSVLNLSVLRLNGEQKDISDKIYYCKDYELRYCSVHDYTLKFGECDKPPRKLDCSRHYGSIATIRCRKMLIDPPPR